MASKLEQLREMTVVVADTGDIDAIKTFKPVDCTTNPTLILKAVEMPSHAPIVDEAIAWGRKQGGSREARHRRHRRQARRLLRHGAHQDRPGPRLDRGRRRLSFDTKASLDKAREIIAAYKERGVGQDRILIKLASTWEGIRAAEILQKEGIDCNLTLLFSLGAGGRLPREAGASSSRPSSAASSTGTSRSEGRQVRARGGPGRPVGAQDLRTTTRRTASRPSSWARLSARPARSRRWQVATA